MAASSTCLGVFGLKWLIAAILICLFFVAGVFADDVFNQNSNTSIPGNLTTPHEIETVTDSNGTIIEYVKDELIIQFKPEIYENPNLYNATSSRIHTQINAFILRDYGAFGLPGAQLIGIPSNITVNSAIIYYSNLSCIDYAQPNYIKRIDPLVPTNQSLNSKRSLFLNNKESLPNDRYFSQQWYLAKINAPLAWDISQGSNDVKIAVMDSVDLTHPDLKNNIWKSIQYNDDDTDHGTRCAGIIAAEGNNSIGIAGVMWHAKIIPLEALKGYNDDREIIAFDYANQNGADIILCSFGFYGSKDLVEKSLIKNSLALVICSAGNDGTNNDIRPHYPSDYELDNIISVAATDQNDNLASFSNYGRSSVDIAAPGKDIVSTIPTSPYYLAGDKSSGTSYSAPMVAGVAGLLKSKYPELSNAQIKAAILNNVDTVPSLNGKVLSGGRLNAYKALQSLEPGSIFVQSNPTGAKIYLDGNDTGFVSPKTISNLSTGSHVVRCSMNGYIDNSKTVSISLGPTTNVMLTLQKLDFSAQPLSGNAPLSVNFTPTGDIGSTSWYWVFGDSTQSTQHNPVHIFEKPGRYAIIYQVYIDGKWYNTWKTGYITVTSSMDAPVANFDTNKSSGVAPLSVQFTDTSSGSVPLTYLWDFGDGTYSALPSPVHTYTATADTTFNITLKISNSAGSSSKLSAITVYVTPPVIPPASINNLDNTTFQRTSITWTWTDPSSTDFSKVMVYMDGVFQTNVTKGIRTYTASSLIPDTAHTIATHTVGTTGLINQTWISDIARTAPDAPSFGSAFIQSTPSGAKIYLDYTDTGFVTPKTLSNLASGSHIIRCSLSGYDDTTQIVSIISGQKTDLLITLQKSGNVPPKADFVASTREGGSPLFVQFTDKSINSPTSWSWTFGDGSTSNGQNPTHTYLKPGMYSVKLKASNSAGSNGLSRSGYIVVSNSGPTPTPTVSPTPTFTPTPSPTPTLTPTPTPIPTSSPTPTPTPTPTPDPGVLKAGFTASPKTGTMPLVVSFQDLSTGIPTSWLWTFGDGLTSNEQNPAHTYLKAGIYSVKLKASNSEGTSGLSRSGYIVVS